MTWKVRVVFTDESYMYESVFTNDKIVELLNSRGIKELINHDKDFVCIELIPAPSN